MPEMRWLPNPPARAAICLGFDGSLNNDWTAITGETINGFSFTPRWGPDKLPTVWNPAKHGGRIPHGEVEAAVDELFTRYRVERMYCDPQDWETDIEDWGIRHGSEHVITWPTNVVTRMHAEIVRFERDLEEGRITHDGDPITALHIGNAKKVGKPGQKYILGKPNEHQKIDVAMARILAHTAARDSLSDGWVERQKRSTVRVYSRRNSRGGAR